MPASRDEGKKAAPGGDRRTEFDPLRTLEVLKGERADCGTLSLSIDRRGNWYYRDSLIGRPELAALFARSLYRDERGRHWLITPFEQGLVEVEDSAFLAVGLRLGSSTFGMRRFEFQTNMGVWYGLSALHPLTIRRMPKGGDAPYLLTERGLEARLTQAVYLELAKYAEIENDVWGIWSDGRFFTLDALG
ncbi:hypothetical protein SAMN07250955_104260 [Arboricoccus pini]|uniref:DUF1285 domain-containing protein n=1 Tax=Arboricoccus pini TaxID=1963835 RepID=A0A212R0A0_9PROT|nr:DUF1285 domain-containing protein [Arboricoccus pini]SNB65413.1 hypothetical protein SAMN07250955_104260 [Arboricoccus pini]